MDQNEIGMNYEGTPIETVSIEQEPSGYSDMPSVPLEVPLKDLGWQISGKLAQANERDNLHKSLTHYAVVLEQADCLTKPMVNELKTLAREAQEARFDKPKSTIVLRKAQELLSSLRVVRR